MLEIIFTASFMREAKRLAKSDKELGEEIAEKIKLFKDRKNHSKLKVHKLQGNLRGFWSFSVNYKYRIVFEPKGKNTFTFHDVGDHEVYR